tara:strand:- start:5508 stop:5846 length:339 start_codon:yes stop_codon:yes gene_type:complete
MSTLAGNLHEQIAAVAPISSVSIGDSTDKSTWKIHFEGATEAEEKAAMEVLRTFNQTQETLEADERIKLKLVEIDLKSIRMLREYVAAQENAPDAIKIKEQSAADERKKLSK